MPWLRMLKSFIFSQAFTSTTRYGLVRGFLYFDTPWTNIRTLLNPSLTRASPALNPNTNANKITNSNVKYLHRPRPLRPSPIVLDRPQWSWTLPDTSSTPPPPLPELRSPVIPLPRIQIQI